MLFIIHLNISGKSLEFLNEFIITQKDNSILRYSPRAVKPRAVSLCTEFGHTAEVLFPYSPDFLCSVRRFSKNGRRFLPFCTENSRSGPLFPAFSEKF